MENFFIIIGAMLMLNTSICYSKDEVLKKRLEEHMGISCVVFRKELNDVAQEMKRISADPKFTMDDIGPRFLEIFEQKAPKISAFLSKK